MSQSRRFLLVASVAGLGLVPQFLSRINGDSAFLLYAADQMLHGARLYVDILEVNPPLIVWMSLVPAALARASGLDPILLYRLLATGLLTLSVIGTMRVLRSLSADEGAVPETSVTILAITFVLFALPRLDWGEREHLALAFMLPWLAVAVRRVEGREVSKRMGLVTGVAAGLGIALKPHFVLVWLGREAAIWLGCRGGRTSRQRDGQAHRRWRVPGDTWSPAALCVAYLVAAFYFTPEYFPLVRELAGPYSRFIRATVLETMLGPAPAVALASLVVAAGLRRLVAAEPPPPFAGGSLRRRAAITVLWWTTSAWAVVALLQLKGFRYHWYPAMALGFLLLCRMAVVARGVHISFNSRLFRAVGTATVVTTVVLTSWGALRQAATPLAPEWDADPSIGPLLEALEGRVQSGDTLAVLSPNMASGFPLTNYLGTVWPLSLPHVWPAIVVYQEALERGQTPELRPTSVMSSLERWSVGTISGDLVRTRPEWILMFRHLPAGPGPHMSKLDLAGYLRRDIRIDSAWEAYDSLGVVGMYSVWHRGDGQLLRPMGELQWHRRSGGSVATAAVSDRELWIAAFIIGLIATDLIATRATERTPRS